MIQRIQSLWLLLAAACAFAGLYLEGYLTTNENFLLMMTSIAVGGLSLIIIFLFKKRTLQLRLCFLGILLEAVLIYLYYREVTTFSQGTYSLTAILHSIIVLAFVLAARSINKDSKMVKDSERLR